MADNFFIINFRTDLHILADLCNLCSAPLVSAKWITKNGFQTGFPKTLGIANANAKEIWGSKHRHHNYYVYGSKSLMGIFLSETATPPSHIIGWECCYVMLVFLMYNHNAKETFFFLNVRKSAYKWIGWNWRKCFNIK